MRSDTVGIVEIRVDEVEVLNLTNQDLGLVDFAQIACVGVNVNPIETDGSVFYIDDLVIRVGVTECLARNDAEIREAQMLNDMSTAAGGNDPEKKPE